MNLFEEDLQDRLNSIRQKGLYRELRGIDSPQGPRLRIDGEWLLNFSSNDYLGLAADRRLMSVRVRTTPRLEVGSPSPLFETGRRPWENFAVSGDGRRFLAVVPQASAGEQPLTVVVNWNAGVTP